MTFSWGLFSSNGAKGTIHCVKKFLPDPLQEAPYSGGASASCVRKQGRRRRIEVLGERVEEEHLFTAQRNAGLPVSLALKRIGITSYNKALRFAAPGPYKPSLPVV